MHSGFQSGEADAGNLVAKQVGPHSPSMKVDGIYKAGPCVNDCSQGYRATYTLYATRRNAASNYCWILLVSGQRPQNYCWNLFSQRAGRSWQSLLECHWFKWAVGWSGILGLPGWLTTCGRVCKWRSCINGFPNGRGFNDLFMWIPQFVLASAHSYDHYKWL